MKNIIKISGFLPYLIILILNVTVDIAHKITISNVLIKSYDGEQLMILTAIINMLILIPFVLLFSPSGYLSDKYPKDIVIKYASLTAIGLTTLITISYFAGWFVVSFIATLLLATQSAIYSPAKYGMIKELVGEDNLGGANAIVQSLTIVSILVSSIIFTIIFENLYNNELDPNIIVQSLVPIGVSLIILSSLEAFFAFKLPSLKAKNPSSQFKIKKYFNSTYLRVNLQKIQKNKNIWLSIIALSIFWGVAQVVIASFPAHYKLITGDSDTIIIQSILAISSIGLIIGSIIAGYYSKKHIEHGFIPISAIGLSLSLFGFAITTNTTYLYIISLSFGFFGGLFIVPLNATIQYFAPHQSMGKILAGNNFIQNIVMIIFLSISILFVYLGFSTTNLFILSSFIMLIGAFFAIKKLPHLFTRMILFPLLRSRYKLIVDGIENIPKQGGVLLLGNHISWIDWLVVQLASPRAIKFVMIRSIYNRWYLRWFLKFFDVISISNSGSRASMRAIKERLDNGEVVAIFPEGHISYNGQLGEFKRGFEMILKGTTYPIVPFYIRGLWGSSFSRADDKFKEITKKERDIIIAFGNPLASNSNHEVVKQKVIELSYTTWDKYINSSQPLQYYWIKQAKSKLFKRAIVDSLGMDLSNLKFITAVLLFAKIFKNYKSQNIAIILPSSAIGGIINMALLVVGKTIVNLNYSAGVDNISQAIKDANIEHIITSEKFIDKLQSKGFIFDEFINRRLIKVEDISAKFRKKDKIMALVEAFISPIWLLKKLYFKRVDMDSVSAVLFSSGSESKPKGIELTHKNLIANIKQVSAVLNFKNDDTILNSLPIFHSFGLTVTLLLPLTKGVGIISIPDPTDAFNIGKYSTRYRATIIFGTSTFYRIYTKNRKLHPLMFQSIRVAVAGAEKLNEDVAKAFRDKFGITLYEGYGATETTPVVSVNMPNSIELDSMAIITSNKPRSVGQPLPGTVIKIINPTTLEELPIGEDGMILIGGVQVMKGYLNNPTKTDDVIVEIDGIRYYKSGDKGHIDSDGFIFIIDRYSRFAKIGGEMISLLSLEEAINDDDIEVLAVNIPDSKKGEKIVILYIDNEDIIRERAKKLDNIMQPSEYIQVEELPKLASGKSDFGKAKEMAMR
ncbi:Putative 2-acylglycerophosphoethanolamine acyltransferase / acyl-acyl carrier protein synthetase [hydrothermal vent metagenome]|uniref:Putative 2-acylglycerophosphoethanolamine acyltransferase / acyl-acyl carrier protein synthetase n=1 Tax=hydrothermal vent metagenome TaxID=652676 RepID=A0A1W1EJB0_9ZZZZ